MATSSTPFNTSCSLQVSTEDCGFRLQSSRLTLKPQSATISTGWDPILRRWRNRMPMPAPKKCHPAISKPAGLTVRGLRGLPGAWQKQQGPKKHLALRKDKQVSNEQQLYISGGESGMTVIGELDCCV